MMKVIDKIESTTNKMHKIKQYQNTNQLIIKNPLQK